MGDPSKDEDACVSYRPPDLPIQWVFSLETCCIEPLFALLTPISWLFPIPGVGRNQRHISILRERASKSINDLSLRTSGEVPGIGFWTYHCEPARSFCSSESRGSRLYNEEN